MKQALSHQWLRQFGEEAIQLLTKTFSDSAIYMVDHQQRILYWSVGAEQLLGYTSEEVLGEHCLKGIRCLQCMKSCGLQEFQTIERVKLTMHTKSGDELIVYKSAQAFYDGAGQFAGGLEILIPAQKSVAPERFIGLNFHGMLTQSEPMRQLFQKIRSVAKTDVPVLARGESGTGKELLARAIHLESPRRKHPFVAVNCSAIPENLIESELFGHAKGAFTGAHKERKGLFEQAHLGSLFLDEIAELPLSLQAKLLRVLETQKFKRVGDNEEIHVDVRIITATHRSLREAVQQGKFRQDLMYRLRVVPLFIPPLRERLEDIDLLLKHFIAQGNEHFANPIHQIDPDAKERLYQHSWPGNVRELRNVVDFAFAIGCKGSLSIACLPPEFQEEFVPSSIPFSGAEMPLSNPIYLPSRHPSSQQNTSPFSEKDRIELALQQCNFHLGNAAELLGMSRATLWRKRKQYDI